MTAAEIYIRSIRNVAKRDYAERYLAFLQADRAGDEPDTGALSYMGAQAVRIQLYQLVTEAK